MASQGTRTVAVTTMDQVITRVVMPSAAQDNDIHLTIAQCQLYPGSSCPPDPQAKVKGQGTEAAHSSPEPSAVTDKVPE